ncbi:NUDIX hydrolase [Candidatus Woesearchaeota archaeon]|nr:NUDIX hydrolase [Candidatus Woesearchaeota archaeon]
MKTGFLHVESNIRLDKIFTADRQIILYKIGAVKKEKQQEVKKKLGEVFGVTREEKEYSWKDLFNQKIAPLLTVDIIIRYKGGIVLIKRAEEPFGWAIPGGFVDFGETVEQAAIRETKEETNLEIQLLRQMHVYSDPKRDPRGSHSITVVFVAEGRGTLKAADDAAEAEVFSLDKPLPKLAFDHEKILKDYVNEEYIDHE